MRPSSGGSAPEAAEVQQHKFRDAANVPLYLQRVKRDIAEEQRLIAQQLGLDRRDDGVPPGHRLLPDAERLEVLNGLRLRQAELTKQHSRLPLKAETEGQRRRANDLEKALREVEERVGYFSKPRVFVKL